jgi:hypothetical protein
VAGKNGADLVNGGKVAILNKFGMVISGATSHHVVRCSKPVGGE